MKAGVYKTPNGNLIYVAKDRTIKATTLSPSSWPGTKVSHRAKDNTVVIADTGYRCEHYADVPNGCTDHQALVDSMHMAASLQPGERVVDYGTKFARVEPATDDEFDRIKAAADDPYKRMAESTRQVTKAMRHVGAAAEGAAEATRRFFTVPPELSAPYGEADLVEWRKKFAESMRKQGFRICHKVSARKHRKRGHTVVPLHDNWFAWRPVDYLHPYQRDALARFVSDERVAIKVPVSIGKSEAGVL